MVIDLDIFDTWPSGLIDAIEPLLSEIAMESQIETAFNLSSERWFERSPPMPATKAAHALIGEAMAGQEIRVFHATRLINPIAIRNEGFRPLSLEAQLAMVRNELAKTLSVTGIDNLDSSIASIDLTANFFSVRQGQVWFTPLRRQLHDGGCEVFFNHWGGEAIQRIATMTKPSMTSAIRKIGMPFVVLARIPAFGCCKFGDSRLAPTMLGRIQERRALHQQTNLGWDVLIERAIPKEWIEDVLPSKDHSLRCA